ncbi:MAG: hypothetical protein SF339_26660 [Blastocatellia bacterium]|nr:hypothetical protein [Blastocatellia bacterium]
MTPEKAFELMNNLDVREPLRKFAFKHSTVVVSEDGTIIEVVRYREQPSWQMDRESLKKHPHCFQFPSWPGRFQSIAELEAWVQESVKLNRIY